MRNKYWLCVVLVLISPWVSADLKGKNAVADIDEARDLVVSGQFDKALSVVTAIEVPENDLILFLVHDGKEQMVQTSFPKKSVVTYIAKIKELAAAKRAGIEEHCKSESPSAKVEADNAINCLTDATRHLPTISPRGPLNQATYGGVPQCADDPEAPECSPLGAVPGYDLQGRHTTFPSAYSAYMMKYLRDKIDGLKAKGPELAKSEKAARLKSEADAKAELESPEGIRKFACQTNTVIEMAKKSIADEKEAAQYSGMVDKAKMYEAGKFITSYSRQLAEAKKQYRAKTGKDWAPAMCGGNRN